MPFIRIVFVFHLKKPAYVVPPVMHAEIRFTIEPTRSDHRLHERFAFIHGNTHGESNTPIVVPPQIPVFGVVNTPPPEEMKPAYRCAFFPGEGNA